MNRAQWALFTRLNGGWSGLWLIADYEAARQHIVASMHGGSGPDPDTWAETTSKGLRLRRGRGSDAEILVDLPWKVIRAWSADQSEETRAEAVTLRELAADLQRDYPPIYPGADDSLGQPYAWDRKPRGTDEEVAADRAWLASWGERRAKRVDAWHVRQREHDANVQCFVESLGPGDEPLDLFEAMERAS